MIADGLLLLAWTTLVIATVRRSRHTGDAGAYGTVIARGWDPPAMLRAVLLVVPAVGFVLVERATGRWPGHPAGTVVGLGLCAGGLALYVWALRTLGPQWSGVVTVRDRQTVVASGPYALLRHPLYLGILLVATGTLLAHPSSAATCVAIGTGLGVALKIPLEERALRRIPGDPYARYRARVPAMLPRPSALVALIRGKPR